MKYDKIKIKVKKPSQSTHLYVLEANGLWKIGVTNNMEKRLKQLQTGNPYEINVMLLEERKNPQKAEKYLHRIYHEKRLKGEWFSDLSIRDIELKLLLFLEQD